MFYFKEIESGKIVYSDLIPELEHFFSTKNSSLNNEKNKKIVCDYLDIPLNNLVSPTQTHSSNIDFVREDKFDYPNTDALILTNTKQAVYLRFADCTPVILYDKKANIAAVAHAGWKGTVSRIVPKTVIAMLEYSKSSPENILALIGPSISVCCYEVGQNVIDGIKASVNSYEGLILGSNVDLKKTNRQQLIELGVPDNNIDVCPYCTCCNNDLFYSYRKEKGTDLRHNAVVKLK